jgi:hypothetical protein
MGLDSVTLRTQCVDTLLAMVARLTLSRVAGELSA